MTYKRYKRIRTYENGEETKKVPDSFGLTQLHNKRIVFKLY